MDIIDFLIGMTVMNAMLHIALGHWKGRMLTTFGFGNMKNLAYGVFNLAISLSLYIYQYGTDHLLSNGMYLGGLTVLLIVLFFGNFFYQLFKEKE